MHYTSVHAVPRGGMKLMSRCSVESVELKKLRDLEFDFVFWLRGFLYQNFSYLGALKLFCFAQI
jgi:hypothetical protein